MVEMQENTIFWFRKDLRPYDHALFSEACLHSRHLWPVYFLDRNLYAKDPLGQPRMGQRRFQFLCESIAELKDWLQANGSDLHLVIGEPEELLPLWMDKHSIDCLYFSEEVGVEEEAQVSTIKERIGSDRIRHEFHSTLIPEEQLGYPLHDLPAVYTAFRKSVERSVIIPTALDTPMHVPPLPKDTIATSIPVPLDSPKPDPRQVYPFRGGFLAGAQRIGEWIEETTYLSHYKETRNQMLGSNGSSKLSPWLANGALGPRQVYDALRSYEMRHGQNASTVWFFYELLWRDFFLFTARLHRGRIFQKSGIHDRPTHGEWNLQRYLRWKYGQTGDDFIDANMLELCNTGWMSNRGRQNVASYLIHHLKLDWRMGAMGFESALIDYDPANNWGNWMYHAGVGNDPRRDRVFDPKRQAQHYDPNQEYLRKWLNRPIG